MFKQKVAYAILDDFYDRFEEVSKQDSTMLKLQEQLDALLEKIDSETRIDIENLLLQIYNSYQDISFAIGLQTGIEWKRNMEHPNIADEFLNATKIKGLHS